MVNAYDVVSKGETICQVGWGLKKVSTSVCVELPYEPVKRKEVFHGGLLTKPFG